MVSAAAFACVSPGVLVSKVTAAMLSRQQLRFFVIIKPYLVLVIAKGNGFVRLYKMGGAARVAETGANHALISAGQSFGQVGAASAS